MTSKRGFTLIEILIAVMLTGLLAGLALGPVVVTVRRVVDTQRDYTDIAALSLTVDFIAKDIYSAMRLASNVLSVKDHEALGGNDEDILMVMSSAPATQNMTSGTVVYKVSSGGLLHSNILPGLYRWVLPNADITDIDHEKLDPSEGQLVLPGVNEFRVEVPTNERTDDNKKEYTGALPAGVFIRIGRGEKDDDRSRTEAVIAVP